MLSCRPPQLEVFAITIRRDLSDLLHVTDVSPAPLTVSSAALGYELPFASRLEKLDADRAMTPQQLAAEVAKLTSTGDSVDIHRNDPFSMPDLV